jgi:hypothetical protein
MTRILLVNRGLRAIATDRFGSQSRRRHESCDVTATDRPASVLQRAVNPRAAIPLVMEGEGSNNRRGQASVLYRVRAHSPGPPGVEATRRHIEAFAQPRHAELRAVRVR